MAMKEKRNVRECLFPFCDLKYKIRVFIVRGIERVSVQIEESNCNMGTNTFVAIQKRMVFYDVKQVECSHLRY